MKIGFYIRYDKYSLSSSQGNVIGDELWGEALCTALAEFVGAENVALYAPNFLPKEELDVMIYLNDTLPIQAFAKKHILYVQNGFNNKMNVRDVLNLFQPEKYDGVITFAKIIEKLLQELYPNIPCLFLPFGVDTSFFRPMPQEQKYAFDCAYIGNDIKGWKATMKYIYPAHKFNFGLFGNWKINWAHYHLLNIWKTWGYKRKFEKISQGKIPQEDVPVLYSSAKINLNCTLQDCIDWDVITLRTFEVLACKGFLITDIVPEAYNTMQGCMVFTTGGKDLTEKIKYYLKNPQEREIIAQKGYEFAQKNASIRARAKELLEFTKKICTEDENIANKPSSY